MTPALLDASYLLCVEARDKGVPLFVLYVDDDGRTKLMGPQLDAGTLAQMLRAVADGCEETMERLAFN